MSRTRSFVTGGNGFVGRKLVDALVARGDDVVVMDIGDDAPHDDIEYVKGDIRDFEAVKAACVGADVVFHNASIVHTKRNMEEFVWDVNLGGSRNVLRACQQNGVKRLVYVSSASAVYEGDDIENGDETLPYSSISQAPYADSKIRAEKELLDADSVEGVRTCAIRPHVIFGPGDQRFMPALLERAKKGQLRFGVGRRTKYSDFTYVDNLIDALILADEKLRDDPAAVGGQAYFITNGEPMPFWDFVSRVLARLEYPPLKGNVPFALAYAVAAVYEAIDTLKGGTLNAEDGFTRFAVRYMCTHHYFNIDKARRDLGYQPKVTIDEGIARTVTHLRAAGAL